MTHRIFLAAAMVMTPVAAVADMMRVQTEAPVATAIANMTATIEAAEARVFAKVDYAAGSASVGKDLRPTTLLIFGSPKIGAEALQTGQTMGLYLPLRVLAMENAAGETWLIYEDPAVAAATHGLSPDHPAVQAMGAALARVTASAGGS